MRPHSALARLQQFTTLGILGCAAGWFAWHVRTSLLAAAAGFVLIAFGYAVFLAVEFVLLRWVGRDTRAPRPSWADLARAWWGEACEAPLVFCWRQPFRWREVPDSLDPALRGRRGVVFLHGFVCNRGFWTPWLRELERRGHVFIAVNLEPVFGSIDEYVPIVEDAVQRVAEATGLRPVLVCHSMGGLAARAWLRASGGLDRVHHIVTIGSPHRGTWLGRFSHLANGRQMRLDGAWVSELARHPSQVHDRFTCWYSNCDNIVFPASTATLPGADNRLVTGAAHVNLAFRPEILQATLSLLH